jgi:spermidine/putrescine transport system ATP-binding protein
VVLRTEQGLELTSPLTPTGKALSANADGCIAVRPELISIAGASADMARK